MIIGQWVVLKDSNQDFRSKLKQFEPVHLQSQSRHAFRQLVLSCNKSKASKEAESKLRVFAAKNLIEEVFSAMSQYYIDNKDRIKNSQRIRRNRKLHQKQSVLRIWSDQCQPLLTRMQVLKYLGKLHNKQSERLAISQWLSYVEEGRLIDERTEEFLQAKQLEQKREAFLSLFERKNEICLQRERLQQVKEYNRKKKLHRGFTVLKFATELYRYRRNSKVTAHNHQQSLLAKKALVAFLLNVSRKSDERMQLKFAKAFQLRLYGGYFLRRFQKGCFMVKEERVKAQFALSFCKEKVNLRVFKSLYLNMIQKINRKNNDKKAIIHSCERLIVKAFHSLKFRTVKRVLQRNRRVYLANTIHNIDTNQLLSQAFASLSENAKTQKQAAINGRGQIVMSLFKKIISAWRNIKQKKKVLRQKQMAIECHIRTKQARSVLTVWMRALDNEAKVQILRSQISTHMLRSTFAALKRKSTLKNNISASLSKKATSYLFLALKALFMHSAREKQLREIQSQLIFTQIVSTQAKTFLALKRSTSISKSVKAFQAQQIQNLQVRAFSGWKYQITLDKTLRGYLNLKHSKALESTFTIWLNKSRQIIEKKQSLSNVIAKWHLKKLSDALKTYKRQAFGERFIDLMKVHMLFPQERYLAHRVVTSWRRFTQYKRNKDETLETMNQISSSLLARRMLRQWIEASMGAIPGRLLGKRLGQAIDRIQTKNAFKQIDLYGQKIELLRDISEAYTQEKVAQTKLSFWTEWKKRYAMAELQKIISQRVDTRLKRTGFKSFKANTELQIYDREMKSEIVSYFYQLPQRTQVFVGQGFMDHVALTEGSLLNLCFRKLKAGADRMKLQRQRKAQADQLFSYKTRVKFFYTFAKSYFLAVEQREIEKDGLRVHCIKVMKKALNAIAVNAYQQRKLRNARLYYNYKLMKRSFHHILLGMEHNQIKDLQQRSTMFLLKKKCISMFKVYFTHWRQRFEQEQFERQAVNAFENCREVKLKRMAFSYLKAITGQRLQIRDMTSKASQYFEQKRDISLLVSTFNSLRDFTEKRAIKRREQEAQELECLKIYAYHLMKRHIQAWRKEANSNQNRQRRSKMYTVLSAWRTLFLFYFYMEILYQRKNLAKEVLDGMQWSSRHSPSEHLLHNF